MFIFRNKQSSKVVFEKLGENPKDSKHWQDRNVIEKSEKKLIYTDIFKKYVLLIWQKEDQSGCR